MACLCRVGSVFFGFGVGFLLFHRFFLLCFALISIHLRGFCNFFLCRAASALSLWAVVLLFHELSSLLLCFFASPLLCFYLLIVFSILSALLYGFPISYLSLRF